MGGRGSNSKIQRRTPNPVIQPMQIQQQPPNILPNQQQAQQANNTAFPATDSQDYHDLTNGRNYYQSQNLTIDQQLAVMNYLADQPETGSLYSMSQNMNHAMSTGTPLTANQQFVHDNLLSSMHNLGQNLNLTRYDHAPFINNLLQQAGIANANYENMSVSQLKQALVGYTYGENKFLSTSHNDFQNAPPGNPFTNRAVKISYKAAASTQAMMPGNGPGGALGEMLLAPSGGNKNFKVVDVKFTGKMARRKGTQSFTQPQIEIIVEAT